MEKTIEPNEKQLPHNIEAEQALLGGILLSPSRLELMEGRLSGDDFFHRPYGRIFEAMLSLSRRGRPIDILMLKNELEEKGELELVGGAEGLSALLDAAPTGAHVEFYAQIIREKSTLRCLVDAASTIIQKIIQPHKEPTEEILDFAEQTILHVAERDVSGEAEHIKDVLKETWAKIEKFTSDHGNITGLPTGYHELDNLLSGLHDDELIIIAGRPAMGKSTLALNIVRNLAVGHGVGVVIFSLEMSAANIAQNLLCSHAKIDAQRLRTGRMTPEEWEHLGKSTGILSQAAIFIDDTPAISLAEIRAKTRRLKLKHNIRLCVVDYLQLVTASSIARGRSREQEISEISRGLKSLAKELQLPVIALSQLNRKPEGRQDNRPILSDLRESGAIEQDADVVLLLHRPDYYDENDSPGQAEVIIAKQRNGPTGRISLVFLRDKLRFENLSLRPDIKESHERF